MIFHSLLAQIDRIKEKPMNNINNPSEELILAIAKAIQVEANCFFNGEIMLKDLTLNEFKVAARAAWTIIKKYENK